MKHGFIALAVAGGLGLGAAAPAIAADPLAASGDASSVTAQSANLNGVVDREKIGARWLFEYSTSPTFDAALVSTAPVLLPGRLVAVERQVSGLSPATTYYWRVVLVIRNGTQTAQSFGATRTFTTMAAATEPAATVASSTVASPPAST